jgi:hypothetical protein
MREMLAATETYCVLSRSRDGAIGIVLMTLGHFAMVFDWSFLLALLLLVFGSGCLKGNIAAQVGISIPRTTRLGARADTRSFRPASISAPWPGRSSAVSWPKSGAGMSASARRES